MPRVKRGRIFEFPQIFGIDENLYRNPIKLLLLDAERKTVEIKEFKGRNIKGFILTCDQEEILLVKNNVIPPKKFKRVIQIITDDKISIDDDFKIYEKRWIKHPLLDKLKEAPQEYSCNQILESWFDTFTFKRELRDKHLKEVEFGLRPPQIGAVHAVLSHWTISHKSAMIVMPTGTGKTEAMLSVLIAQQCGKVLVLVPSNVLRTQIADKFINLGVLKRFGIVDERAKFPIVGLLKHRLRDIKEVEAFFSKCNVVVSTMAVLTQCSKNVQKKVSGLVTHLFIDEAHHIPAKTWSKFRDFFIEKPIIQFTATPFRSDGKYVEGKIIFDYPLLRAQQEGYFKKINFLAVEEYDLDLADQKIAQKVIEQLKNDLVKGHDHVVMARGGTIKRATDLFEIYKQYTEFSPVLIHSQIKGQARKKILNAIVNRKTRIIVCVDMFGEGFDLPQLKIAALHDIHKTLGVVLQFTGRFTRNSKNIGDATFIANIADVKVDESLNELYAEDADWNYVIQERSLNVINEQVDFSDFLENFDENLIKEVPIQNLLPALSDLPH